MFFAIAVNKKVPEIEDSFNFIKEFTAYFGLEENGDKFR